jgi:GAF domain/Restriction endonuclease
MRVDTAHMLAPTADEKATPVWGEGERPAWLAPEDQQPKKREWSPVRDRMEAELELKARLEEQRRLRKKEAWQTLAMPVTWIVSLVQAVVSVSREDGDALVEAPKAPPTNFSTMLDTLPPPRAPGETLAPPPAEASEEELPAVWEAHPEPEWQAPPAEEPPPSAEAAEPAAEEPPPAEHHEVDWSQPPPPRPEPPPTVYRAPAAPDKDWRPEAGPTPAWEIVPEAEPEPEPAQPEPAQLEPAQPEPAPAAPAAPAAVEADELARVILGTCVRTSAAEVGILSLLQDDVLVVRASSGIDAHIAGRLALDTLSDICLDVIYSGQSFTASAAQATPDPDHPSSILSVPLLLAGVGVGAVLLLNYAPDRAFSADQERLVRALAEVAGPELSAAGAFRMAFERPGVLWRRLDAPPAPAHPPEPEAAPAPPAAAWSDSDWEAAPAAPEPPAPEPAAEAVPTEPLKQVPATHRTMSLDPEQVKKLIAEAKAAREAEETAVAETAAATPPTAEIAAPAPTEPLPAPEPVAEEAAPAPPPPAPEPEPVAAPAPAPRARPSPKRDHHRVGWRARVQSRMTRVRQQREEDEARYRSEILAAIRNLSWDGYQALVADIFRRKAFEVLPPPAEGTDLDVIDLVVDRDGQRMLVNCQLRGEMDIPIEAVTEMATVVYNYSVAGAYLIADGSFAPEAGGAAQSSGIVLIDGNALIDLTIETTLKDERKQSFTGRLARRLVGSR